MLSKRQVTANVGEAVEKRESWVTVSGNVNCWSDCGKWASQVAPVVKNLPANAGDLELFNPWVRKIPSRRKWQPTPAFLPGISHGQRSYSPWDGKELNTTEVT